MPNGLSTRRSTTEKLALFRAAFTGLTKVYGTYDPRNGRSWQVKEPVTDAVHHRHLLGKQPYGVYLLEGSKTRAAVIDFDNDDAVAALDVLHAAAHYGIDMKIECSKSKGYHVWMWVSAQGGSAAKARCVLKHILDETGYPGTEVFPKQDALGEHDRTFGNFINAPLFGALVPKGRTVFLDPLHGLQPYADQWAALEHIERVTEQQLDDVMALADLSPGTETVRSVGGDSLGTVQTPLGGLPPCARRMLAEGVGENQRVACFRLAVQLRRVGLPYDLAAATLLEWSTKNRPLHGKRIITETEVKAQTSQAYLKLYEGHGCEDPAVAPFCDPSCPVYARRSFRLESSE